MLRVIAIVGYRGGEDEKLQANRQEEDPCNKQGSSGYRQSVE
jgi:hypothetical protein